MDHTPAYARDELGDRAGTIARIRRAVGQVVVGNGEALDQLLVALLCRGHALVEDVPGVGKTMLARSLAKVLGCEFRRAQLTPDVLPSDITGSNVFNQRTSEFEFRPGPVFTQVLLADEINRATPRSQSALLEAMEERQVTVDGETRSLAEPFLVLATQNPVELEGTFPLPEAQLDRFVLRVTLGYPSLEEEHEIVPALRARRSPRPRPGDRPGGDRRPAARPGYRRRQQRCPLVLGQRRAFYAPGRPPLARSEPTGGPRPSPCSAGPSVLQGRAFALPDDVKALASPVLAHRLVLSPTARLRGATPGRVIDEILARLAVPVEDESDEEASAP
jgi:MoxR-like ATPase